MGEVGKRVPEWLKFSREIGKRLLGERCWVNGGLCLRGADEERNNCLLFCNGAICSTRCESSTIVLVYHVLFAPTFVDYKL